TDEDMPRILETARDAGATSASYAMRRLPGSVKAVFESRLRERLPLRAERVLHRIRATRGGKLYDARSGLRGRGSGRYADAVSSLFEATVRRLGLRESCFQRPEETPSTFRRPTGRHGQLPLL